MQIIPDSSVPISTGTVPDLGVPVSTGTVKQEPTLYPKPTYAPQPATPKSILPKEFGVSEAVWGGMMQTAWAAAMMANDMPAFDVQPGYDAEAELLSLEQEQQYQVSNDDREHLLRSKSPGEFMYRQFQIDEKTQSAEAMAARPVLGTLGAVADVDIALGYGIGAVSRAASLGRAATMGNLTIGTGAGTTGTYAYAGPDAPFNTTDAAVHIALSTSLAFLYGTGFKYKQPIPTKVPMGTIDNSALDFEMDTLVERVVKEPASPAPLIINRGADSTTIPKPKKPKRQSKTASKKITKDPEQATDSDLLDAIDDSTDDDFKNLD